MRDCGFKVACIYRASLQDPYAILRSLAGAIGPISRGDARQRRTQFALRKRARDTRRDNLETARDANNRGARANVGQRSAMRGRGNPEMSRSAGNILFIHKANV